MGITLQQLSGLISRQNNHIYIYMHKQSKKRLQSFKLLFTAVHKQYKTSLQRPLMVGILQHY